VEGSALSYTVMTQPAHGSLSGTAPTLTYTPVANFSGADSFTFRVNDGSLSSASATVSIMVTAVNDPPVASAQSVATAEDTAKAITLSGSDPDGNVLTYVIVTSPAHGTLSGSVPNVTYTPAANYNGSDFFTFRVNDGLVDSSPATVSITVSAVNDAPVADAQSVATDKNVAKAVVLGGSDVDGDSHAYTVVTQPARGVLSGSAPTLTYTPNSNVTGADSFTFRVSDGSLNSAAATVSITIAAGPNTAPVASSQNTDTAEDTARIIVLSGTDADSDPLTFTVTTPPGHGTLTGTAPNLTYTPAVNFNGNDSFAFKVNDGVADSAAAMVSISVIAVNDAPVANAQSVSTPQDTAGAITLSASDVDGDALTYSITTPPAHGSLSGSVPNLTYTPAAGYRGADSLVFKANDGLADSASVTVTINVTAVNHPPVASPQSVTTAEDTATGITLQGADADNDTLAFVITAQPSHGSLSGVSPNVTYTPTANYNGADSFAFKVNDGTADSPPAAVNLAVTAVNDAPALNPIASVLVAQNSGAQTVLLTGINAGPGETQTLVITANSSNPSLIPSPTVTYASPSSTGSLSFTPTAEATGTATITVTVDDGGGVNSTFTRTFLVTVEPATSPISIDPIPDMTISESAPEQRVALTGIGTTASTGAGTTTVRSGIAPWLHAVMERLARRTRAPLTVTAAASDTTLIPTPTVNYISPNSTGTLVFKPVPNSSGYATLSVTVADGRNTPVTRSFKVTVTATTNLGAPSVVLTAPAMNASFCSPATITLAAAVKANGQSVSKVQFFAGTTLVAEDAAAPYSMEWQCQDTGSYGLMARALFDSGGTAESPTVTVTVADLPVPWETTDIGSGALPGSVMAAENGFEIAGAGILVGETDSCRYLYQPLSADGAIKVRVDRVGFTGSDARVGVMIRENLTSDSRCAFLGLSPDGLFHWQSRAATGAALTDRSMWGGSSPVWLRVVRHGDLIVGLVSRNGTSWSTIGVMSLPMAPNVHIGLVSASGALDRLNTSTFSSPSVVP
jgi:hypothetical protein